MKKLKFKFANLILDARLDAGLTQSQVAESVGISVRWMQRIEYGERLPGTLTMLRLILFFNIDPEELREVVELNERIYASPRKILKSRR